MNIIFFFYLTESKLFKRMNELHYIAKSIGSPLLMKGLTTLVISMSMELMQDGAEDGSRVACSGKTLQFFVCFICFFVVLCVRCC